MRSKTNPIILVLVVVIVIGIAFVAFVLSQQQTGSSADALPVRAFIEKPMNYVGYVYQLDAQIDSQLAWKQGVGRILTVKPMSDREVSIPVYVPDSLQQKMHMGERYRLDVLVTEKNILTVQSLEKI